jgi:hypothetical protein
VTYRVLYRIDDGARAVIIEASRRLRSTYR